MSGLLDVRLEYIRKLIIVLGTKSVADDKMLMERIERLLDFVGKEAGA